MLSFFTRPFSLAEGWGLGTRLTADVIENGIESFDGKEILDNLIVAGPKKLVKNWLNINTWPGCLPFRTVESIPGRLPGNGRSPFIL